MTIKSARAIRQERRQRRRALHKSQRQAHRRVVFRRMALASLLHHMTELPDIDDDNEIDDERELLPDPPGIWPPLEGPDFPLFPVPPEDAEDWAPGEIWPPLRPPGGGGGAGGGEAGQLPAAPGRPPLRPRPRPPETPGQPLPGEQPGQLPQGGEGEPEHPIAEPRPFFACAYLPDYGWRWICVDLNEYHVPDDWRPEQQGG